MKRSMSDNRAEEPRRDAGLEVRYGKIGISAVEAALRYQSDGKNPAYAPCKTADRPDPAEAA
jgi:hypothetical protein